MCSVFVNTTVCECEGVGVIIPTNLSSVNSVSQGGIRTV